MKIKNISCTQFAGVRDQSVSFTDGINVIYGKNESGKSTLVNLLSRTLFQDAKVGFKSVKDTEFRKIYFPGARKGSSHAGDFADGKVSFETESGTYTLTKEWGADPRCTLSTPDGVIRDQGTIEKVLRDALTYGEGVYSDMLFSSQKNTDISLQTILDAKEKTEAKQELANVVSQAFAESDGIPVDAIEQAINKKIDEIAGKHWDFEREVPARKTGGGRWANGLGTILNAYYTFEDAKTVLEDISNLEREADRAADEYANQNAAVRVAEDNFNKFNTFASRLAVQSERKKAIDRIEKDIQKIREVLSAWPEITQKLEKAKELQTEQVSSEMLTRYNAAKKIYEEIDAITEEGGVDLPCPTDEEISKVKASQRKIETLQNRLCGMNLTADITMLGGNAVEITTLRNGERIDTSAGTVAISEAVKIFVPGVMEMKLAPANVNVDEIEKLIAEQEEIYVSILDECEVESIDELEKRAKDVNDANAKLDKAWDRLAMVLGSVKMDALEEAVKTITWGVRSKDEIAGDILSLCGNSDVTRFITAKETILEGYVSEYGSINDLKAKAFDLDSELRKAKASVGALEDVPEEFVNISDPEAYLAALQNTLKAKQTEREMALTAKTATASKLEGYKEKLTGDPVAEKEKAERIFEEQKTLLGHWLHIAEVLKEQKENIHDNPMQDLAEHFTHYLSVISSGKISSEFLEADKLNMNIYSDNKLLDYGKLSEGTKETVSLAFRLAVLDHLFPEGGGVIVFDDPFTDMDADRMAQSCELIKECAQRHQVIFLTCREEYLEMLKGNRILF